MRSPAKRPLFPLLVTAILAWAQARTQTSVEFFPEVRLFPRLAADALTHHISLSKVTHNRDWIGTIGGVAPLVSVRSPEVTWQLSAAVTTFNRLIKPPGITVYTIDYKVDIPIDVRYDDFAFRLAIGHYSGHFADDAIELLGKSSIQSVKDYLTVAASHDLPHGWGFVYAGVQYNYNNIPVHDRPWQIQWGFDAGNVPFLGFAVLYCAVDIKLKQEVAWGSTQSYQAGARLVEKARYLLRVAYTHRRGHDERGQFFNTRETVNLISIFLDI